jgi:hypothetical protein
LARAINKALTARRFVLFAAPASHRTSMPQSCAVSAFFPVLAGSRRFSGERRAEQRTTLPSWTSHDIECGEPRMPKDTFNPEPPGTIGRDFKIFADPGFLVSLALGMLLIGIIAGVLLYFNAYYSISPF